MTGLVELERNVLHATVGGVKVVIYQYEEGQPISAKTLYDGHELFAARIIFEAVVVTLDMAKRKALTVVQYQRDGSVEEYYTWSDQIKQ